MANKALVTLAASLGLALSLGFASSGATQSPATAPPTPEPSATPAPAGEPGYAGTEACVVCHEDPAKSFQHTVHAGNAQGCEGCHGPGQAHIDASGDKTKIRSLQGPEPARVIGDLHGLPQQGRPEALDGLDARQPEHLLRGVPHRRIPRTRSSPRRSCSKPQMVLCTGCHLQKKAQLLRPGHMPVREGKMQCTSCHNPHGTPNDKMLLQTSVNQNCYTCHAEKRGPFLWEHPPVRENCLNCHDAHGTVNEKMLKVKAPLLCQQCHQTASHPGPAYPAQSGTPSTRPACTATPRSTGRSTRRATGSSGRGERP